jgi:hypothetical protein
MHSSISSSSRRGQAMIIAVLSLGGAMLIATAIAGLLTLYQLRATTNSVNSSKSIFAADTGIGWALFSYYCKDEARCSGPLAAPTLANGTTITVTCFDDQDKIKNCDTGSVTYATSKGTSLNTSRAFYIILTGATSTFP